MAISLKIENCSDTHYTPTIMHKFHTSLCFVMWLSVDFTHTARSALFVPEEPYDWFNASEATLKNLDENLIEIHVLI